MPAGIRKIQDSIPEAYYNWALLEALTLYSVDIMYREKEKRTKDT